MEGIRKPFQGVWNIIRFNWHFYLLSMGGILLILILNHFLPEDYLFYTAILGGALAGTTAVSLLVSYYVYDLSGLYKLDYLDELGISSGSKMLNIHAGFDETSILLKNKFPAAELQVFDFYDPLKHTEVSIKRARKAYPPYPATQKVHTARLPLNEHRADHIFLILSAHEIRNGLERIAFFSQLQKGLKEGGKLVVIEHLRDVPNFLGYNLGFFHFIPKTSWYKTFEAANLKVSREAKITPFITSFILEKHGATP